MKRIIALIVGVALWCAAVNAQTNTVPEPPPPETSTNQPPLIPEIPGIIIGFLSNTASNWYVAPYGIYSSDTETFGAGIGVGYAITPNVVTVMRMDYLNDEIWMPSGSVQLQAPIRLMNRLQVTPFAFGGIATPLSGRGDDNRTAAGIAGAGMATRFNDHIGVIYDVEYWSNFSGPQHRFGLFWKF